MSMSEVVYTVRKQGSIKVNNRDEALAIIAAGAKEGYNFAQQKQGWSFLVTDMDA